MDSEIVARGWVEKSLSEYLGQEIDAEITIEARLEGIEATIVLPSEFKGNFNLPRFLENVGERLAKEVAEAVLPDEIKGQNLNLIVAQKFSYSGSPLEEGEGRSEEEVEVELDDEDESEDNESGEEGEKEDEE